MSEPIISPWIYYFIGLLGKLSSLVNLGLILSFAGAFLVILLYLNPHEDVKDSIQFKRIGKYLGGISCILLFLFIIIPDRDTAYKMLVAKYVTQENIENLGDNLDKVADKVVEKIKVIKDNK